VLLSEKGGVEYFGRNRVATEDKRVAWVKGCGNEDLEVGAIKEGAWRLARESNVEG